jgi:hypothetical protein
MAYTVIYTSSQSVRANEHVATQTRGIAVVWYRMKTTDEYAVNDVELVEVMIPPLENVIAFDAYDTVPAVKDIWFPVPDLSFHAVTEVVPVTVIYRTRPATVKGQEYIGVNMPMYCCAMLRPLLPQPLSYLTKFEQNISRTGHTIHSSHSCYDCGVGVSSR